MPKSTTARVGILVALLVVAITGGVFLIASREPGKAQFCQPSLPIQDLNGRTVAVQTRGSDGGQCEIPETNSGMDTLGLDCKVRGPDGKVVETVTSSRAGGTC